MCDMAVDDFVGVFLDSVYSEEVFEIHIFAELEDELRVFAYGLDKGEVLLWDKGFAVTATRLFAWCFPVCDAWPDYVWLIIGEARLETDEELAAWIGRNTEGVHS